MTKKKLVDLDPDAQKAVIDAFENEGVSKVELEKGEFEVVEEKSAVTFSFRGVSISVPAPSQGVIDKLWKEHGDQIITTLLTLAAVFAGAAIARSSQNDEPPA